MNTMSISLPDALKAFVDEQTSLRGHDTGSAYVCDLIRKDQEGLRLRGLLLEGANSLPSSPVDSSYFDGLRDHVRDSMKSKINR